MRISRKRKNATHSAQARKSRKRLFVSYFLVKLLVNLVSIPVSRFVLCPMQSHSLNLNIDVQKYPVCHTILSMEFLFLYFLIQVILFYTILQFVKCTYR